MEPKNLNLIVDKIERIGFSEWLLKALTASFEVARRGKLKTYDEHEFELRWMQNIVNLRDTIVEWNYEPNPSVAFIIFDPMVREIFAAPFRDRVVHHFLYAMQAGWWDRRFIYDSYSCRVGKGTLFGIKRAQSHMRKVTADCKENAFVVKLDIRGYFMSLSRERLYQRIRWGLERQFAEVLGRTAGRRLFMVCDYLWRQVLLDDPVSKAWKRGNLAYWESGVLPPEKSLFCQPPGQGIVIGNLTSQLVSNVYLDQLDRFVFKELGYRHYGRYVDDFFIMVPEAQYSELKKTVPRIERFLADELGLKLHPKKRYYQSVYKGMSFLGARIYPRCLIPSDRLQKNFRRSAYECLQGQREVETIVSYLGLMKHMNSCNFLRRIFEEVGWDYA